jgi:DNA-binding NtrC family response regulator
MTSQFPEKTRRSLKILILDDDFGWRNRVAFGLETSLGIQPIVASSAKEALEILTERPIDVVVSDLFMPEMDGFQVLKRVRVLHPQTKVILMSGDFGAFPISPFLMIEQGALAAVPKSEIDSTLPALLRNHWPALLPNTIARRCHSV